jgi:hypothetical protein
VEKDNSDLAYIEDLCAALTAESLEEIDFDRLRRWLSELGAALPSLMAAKEEAFLLREDLKTRIGGMLKAIVIADRGKSITDDSLEILDHLPEKSAAELIGLYRRTQARFRDTFPSGSGLITPRRAPFQHERKTTKRV